MIRIILADDHRIIREGIRTLLEREEGLEVVGEANDGREVLRLHEKCRPEVVIMDIAMPNLNGIDATRQLVDKHPDTKIIALSMHSDHRFVAEMLQAGASGYLLKDCVYEELVRAIHLVCQNKTYLSPDIASVLVEDYRSQAKARKTSQTATLSAREREVLQLIAEGHSTREVAEILFVSVKTVETHRSQIARKLNLHSLAELTKYAIREGLTSL